MVIVHEQAHGSSAATKSERMELDLKAIEAARTSLDQGAVTPSYGPWRNDIVKLLNDC